MSCHADRPIRFLTCVCLLCGPVALRSAPEQLHVAPAAPAGAFSLERLPADFVENRGQWAMPAKFAARRRHVAASFEPGAIRLNLGAEDRAAVRLVFEGASSDVAIVGEDRRAGVYNFFIGNDPSAWRSRVPSYSSVLYRALYDGVDMRVRDHQGRFEYDLVIAPGTDLSQVVIRVEGATRLELGADGALLVHTPAGVLRQTPPQTTEASPGGAPRAVDSRFRIVDERRYGFDAPSRDETLGLTVDPGLVWSTFTGGTGGDELGGIEKALDGSGDIFLSGYTTSADFTPTPISPRTATQKSFVARIRGDGSALVYLTFIAGIAGQTYGRDMAADSAGGVILVGTTADLDFPTSPGAYQTSIANTNSNGASEGDGFVTRLDAAGGFVFSTYLGGAENDGASNVRLDPSGAVIVAGTTSSPNFPSTAGAFDPSFNAPPPGDNTAFALDVFITRLNPAGSQVTYSTFFGGQTYEAVTDMVVDPQGFVTLVGFTTSSATGTDIPITPGALDSTWNGSEDGYVARFKLDGAGAADLKYSTFIGGVNWDNLFGLAFNPSNPEVVTVVGFSWVNMISGTRVPTTAGSVKPVLTPNPPATDLFPEVQSGFATQFRFPATGGGSMVWSTFAGGNFNDFLSDVAVNDAGVVTVVGGTRSYDLQTTRGAFDRTYAGTSAGASDCFLWQISPNGAQLLYSTFLGGPGEECDFFAHGRIVSMGGNTVAIAGITNSVDFPTTPGALMPEIDEVTNGSNLFISKLTLAADASGDLNVDPPTLLSPPNGALTDYGSAVRFRWSDVPDLAGVEAYVLEVSTKPDFPTDFTQHRLSTPGTEVILEGLGTSFPWYWRVQTADRAGNLSAWSATSTFTTGQDGGLPSVSMVQVYPANVVGGTAPFGVLHITKPAPAGGVVATLSARDGRGFIRTAVPAAVPETITVPAGALTVNFPISTTAVSVPTPVHLYATIAGIGAKGGISVDPVAGVQPKSITLNPLTVTGGNPVTGTVTLTGPAPAGGTVVPLGSSHPAFASVPAGITVPAGSTSASFPIATSPVPFAIDVRIEAVGGASTVATLSLKTPGVRMTSLTLNASTVTGGTAVTGTVTFSGPVPATPFPSTSGAIVKLTSTSPAVGLAPLIVVPVGASAMTFGINVQNVPATTPLNIVASYDDTTMSAPLTITGSSVALSSLTLNVNTLTGGQGGVGFVNLTDPAPPGHVLVTLSASHPAISLPPNVSVSSGSSSGLFSFGAYAVTSTTPATITASFGSSTASAGVTVNPSVTVHVTSLALSPASVSGGASSTATVTLSGPAPASGATVQLSSMGPATVPSSIVVPPGATSATFNVATTSVMTTTEARVWALLNITWAAALTVTPGTAQPTLSALSLNPTSVAGGTSSQGTVTLTSAAASGGAVVSLSSSNTSAATVPVSVTVPAGSTSRTFTVSTLAVSSSTSVTVTGSFGATRSATLGVTAASSQTPTAPALLSPANGATLPLPVGFDWTDVTAASSYRIQVDDSSTFSAPRVVDQTVTVSQFTATALTARQYWWRVSGINSAGTAGPWSAVRSFTVQTAPSAPALSAIAVSPGTVVGGNASTGTATLTSGAPAGGVVVTLSSSHSAAAVSGSVMVPAGATTATFGVTTSAVTASTPVTITGTSGEVTRTASLTVTPPATTVTLSVTATGRSGERVSSSPAGISVSVGATGSATFASGTSVTLSVSNGRDAIWSGACSSGGNKTKTCTLTLSASASVTANVQ